MAFVCSFSNKLSRLLRHKLFFKYDKSNRNWIQAETDQFLISINGFFVIILRSIIEPVSRHRFHVVSSWKVKQSREISAQPKIRATLTNRNSREPDDYSLKIVQIKIALTI